MNCAGADGENEPSWGSSFWNRHVRCGRGGCVIITTAHACRFGGMERVEADGTRLLRFSTEQQVAGHSALFFFSPNQIKQLHGTAQPEL